MEQNKPTKEFKIEIGTIFQDNKRDITITSRTKIQAKNGQWMKYYKYTCNTCGFDSGKHYSLKNKEHKNELWTLENSLLKGGGCSCCSNKPKIVVENINSIYKTDKWMIPIIGEKCAKIHTYRSSDKVEVTCPDCGNKRDKKISIYNIYSGKSMSCEICGKGEKYPNKFMCNILKQLNIDFEREYSPEWINPRRYDFYIPSMNLIIEMDGGLGHGKKYNNMSGLTQEESKNIDFYKDEQAILHNINVIRIDCYYKSNNRFEYIKDNILNSKLIVLFNLENVDWNKCDDYACSNLIKIACGYKKNNPNMTTTEIGQLMGGYTDTTIKNWLHIGNKLNWCDYNSKDELRKSAIKCGKANAKKIEMFRDNISLGIFESASKLGRQSENLFGIKLGQGMISEVCTGKKKLYKGFYFKYV